MKECEHQPRRVAGQGWEALLTLNGNWTLYRVDRPHLVESIKLCPGCGLVLWALPPDGKRYPEAQAHSLRKMRELRWV